MCFDMHQSEKLTIFVDDMRRRGVALAGPDLNFSEAEFTVEQTDEGYAVRYALAGIRNVGEKAMDGVVAERVANGHFTSLEDLFRRVPNGALNRRALEGLAAAGAFDSVEPNRAKVLANADMLLAITDEAERNRTSGQHGLFGGDDHAAPAVRLVETPAWSRTEQMAKERENFGFYFASHPVEQFRAVAKANGARSYSSLMTAGVSGGREMAVIAAMVEGVQRRKTKRGKDFVIAELSDSSGQFTASCFEESLVEPMLKWAADATCLLLSVELDAPNADEPPRVTVRGGQPLSEVKSAARMVLELEVVSAEAFAELAVMLPKGAPGRGEVVAKLNTGPGDPVQVLLGRDFALDGDLAELIATLDGVRHVALSAKRGPVNLRLVA
jgi:DNA polymerase-3 subunit alpha